MAATCQAPCLGLMRRPFPKTVFAPSIFAFGFSSGARKRAAAPVPRTALPTGAAGRTFLSARPPAPPPLPVSLSFLSSYPHLPSSYSSGNSRCVSPPIALSQSSRPSVGPVSHTSWQRSNRRFCTVTESDRKLQKRLQNLAKKYPQYFQIEGGVIDFHVGAKESSPQVEAELLEIMEQLETNLDNIDDEELANEQDEEEAAGILLDQCRELAMREAAAYAEEGDDVDWEKLDAAAHSELMDGAFSEFEAFHDSMLKQRDLSMLVDDELDESIEQGTTNEMSSDVDTGKPLRQPDSLFGSEQITYPRETKPSFERGTRKRLLDRLIKDKDYLKQTVANDAKREGSSRKKITPIRRSNGLNVRPRKR